MSVSWRAAGVGMGVGVGALLAWRMWRKYSNPDTPTKWEDVGEVGELIIYPLKSGRGVKVKHAAATRYGLTQELMEDRSFLAVTPEGKFITGRQAPRLTIVSVTLKDNKVTLQAKDTTKSVEFDLNDVVKANKIMDAVVFNADVKGYDCGDAAANWLSEVVYGGEDIRLLYSGDLTRRRKAREPTYFSFPQYKASDRVLYADTCAYMLTTETSLADLNTRLERPVTLEWFRSNIVVRGAKKPYDEDDWAFVMIGDVVLRRLKPCDRCAFTYVNPETGKTCPDQEPLATLKKYRHVEGPEQLQKTYKMKPVFGSHLGIDTCGTVRVGDKVKIARASSNPRWQF